jgi:hypothetical protein
MSMNFILQIAYSILIKNSHSNILLTLLKILVVGMVIQFRELLKALIIFLFLIFYTIEIESLLKFSIDFHYIYKILFLQLHQHFLFKLIQYYYRPFFIILKIHLRNLFVILLHLTYLINIDIFTSIFLWQYSSNRSLPRIRQPYYHYLARLNLRSILHPPLLLIVLIKIYYQ